MPTRNPVELGGTGPDDPCTMISSKVLDQASALGVGDVHFPRQLLYLCTLIEALVLQERIICIDHHDAMRPVFGGNPVVPIGPSIFLDVDELEQREEQERRWAEIEEHFEEQKASTLLSSLVRKREILEPLIGEPESPIRFVAAYEDRGELGFNENLVEHLYTFFEDLRSENPDNATLDIFYDLVSRVRGSSPPADCSWEDKVKNADHTRVCLYERIKALEQGHSYISDSTHFSQVASTMFERYDKIAVSEIARAYTKVAQTVSEKQRRLIERRPSSTLPIPLIPAIVFSRAKDVSDIIPRALELRGQDGVRQLRETFTAYERIIRNTDLPMVVSITALETLDTNIARICEKLELGAQLDISELKSGPALAKALSDGLDKEDSFTIANVFFGRPLKWIVDRIKTRHVHYFFRLGKTFLAQQDTSREVKRLFGREVSRRDIISLDRDLWASGFKAE